MQIERVTQINGVTARCMSGAGATPVLRTSRVGSAALVAPAPDTSHIQNVSGADTRLINTGCKADWFRIRCRF